MSERSQTPDNASGQTGHRDTRTRGPTARERNNERMPKKAKAAPKKAIAKAAPKKAAGATAKALSVVGATANAGLIKVDGVLLDTHLAGAGGAAVHEDYAYLGNQVDIKPGTAFPSFSPPAIASLTHSRGTCRRQFQQVLPRPGRRDVRRCFRLDALGACR